MSKSTIKLENLRKNYQGVCREAFEDMVTHMFMRKLRLCTPPIRRKNQEGIESDPIEVNEDVDKDCKAGTYAYQAKFYDPGTTLSKRKQSFLDSIEVAKKRGVTDLFFYVNKELTENTNSKSGGEKNAQIPNFQAEINKAADAAHIKVQWYPAKRIEDELVEPEYEYLRKIFIANENEFDSFGFYQNICTKMCIVGDEHKEVYGDISLLDSYIEPVISDRNGAGQLSPSGNGMIGHDQSIREYLEEWVTGKDYITIICGDPGHGKTSLGWKAVYDFYKDGWLENKVENVFCFSINPAELGNEDKNRIFTSLDIRPLLSWESSKNYRTDSTQKADKCDCNNALVFLDGFDELMESIPGHTMEEFLQAVCKYLKTFENDLKPHIIITTRKMAIPPRSERIEYPWPDDDEKLIPIKELQPVTYESQYQWIKKYIRHMHKNKHPFNEAYLEDYRKMYYGLDTKDEMRAILGVPIIFRMIVVAEYIPESGSRPAEIYDKLFTMTLERHNVLQLGKNRDYFLRKLSRHALRVYADNGDSAEIPVKFGLERFPWIYSFYTIYKAENEIGSKEENKSRVGFLHKTFYEYFLASGILSWLRACGEDGWLIVDGKKCASLADMLFILGKQKLSEEVLLTVKVLYEAGKKKRKNLSEEAFATAYRILRETDGILNLPKFAASADEDENRGDLRQLFYDIDELMRKEKTTPLKRGEYVFCNVVSICSVCGYPVQMDGSDNDKTTGEDLSDSEHKLSLNESALRSYDLSGIHLEGAILRNLNLDGGRLVGGHLMGACLKGSHLKGAILEEAHLESSMLDWTCLMGANLMGAHLLKANLDHAHLESADLMRANFEQASLKYTHLESTRLEGANFVEANLEGALLDSADLSTANLQNSILNCAVLRNAYLDGALLANSYMRGAVLEGTYLVGANLQDADLTGAYLDGIVYDDKAEICRGVSYGTFTLDRAELNGANLTGSFLSKEQFYYLKRAGALGLPDKLPKIQCISEERSTHGKRANIILVTRGGNQKYIDLTRFGHYPQGVYKEDLPLSWRLLRLEYDKALIISEKLIECKSYHYSKYGDITWENSELRKWLNEAFLENAFTESERIMIARVCNQNPDNSNWTDLVEGGIPTWDRVFALSIDEANTYFRNNKDRRPMLTPYVLEQTKTNIELKRLTRVWPDGQTSGWWWLRSPGLSSNFASGISEAGGVGQRGLSVDDSGICVRPALWLNL